MDSSPILSTPEMKKKKMIIGRHSRSLCMALDLAFFGSHNYRSWEYSMSKAVDYWRKQETLLGEEKINCTQKLFIVQQDLVTIGKEVMINTNQASQVDSEARACVALIEELSLVSYYGLVQVVSDMSIKRTEDLSIIKRTLLLLLEKKSDLEKRRFQVHEFFN